MTFSAHFFAIPNILLNIALMFPHIFFLCCFWLVIMQSASDSLTDSVICPKNTDCDYVLPASTTTFLSVNSSARGLIQMMSLCDPPLHNHCLPFTINHTSFWNKSFSWHMMTQYTFRLDFLWHHLRGVDHMPATSLLLDWFTMGFDFIPIHTW